MTSPNLHRLSTPRAAAVAGVLFALLFGASLVLIRIALPEGAEPGSQWLIAGSGNIKIAAALMPFAGIAFLWFIGVVRDGFGGFEDKFFSCVFIGSGLLFLAMMFVTMAVGAGLEATNNLVVDSLSYEGSITAATITGAPGTYNLVRGTPTTAADSQTVIASLVRLPNAGLPNGGITANDVVDWSLSSNPTPGAANTP